MGTPFFLQGQSIRLMCASSLQMSIDPLVREFSLNNKIKIEVIYGSSSLLRNQIQAGATADIFIFAGETQARWLTSRQLAKSFKPIGNTQLVLLVRQGAPIKTLRDLATPGIRIAVADSGVPIGSFTENLLNMAVTKEYLQPGELQAIYRNIVTRDFSAQSLKNKIQLREADAAFIYLSQWDSGDVVKFSPQINPPITYLIGIAADSRQVYWSQRWIDFLQTPDSKKKLRERGVE